MFVERNWNVSPVSGRSRDNLPNPQMAQANPYVPEISTAISDLFELLSFNQSSRFFDSPLVVRNR